MAEREFKAYPERLTDVLDEDVVCVLVTGYAAITRSPISIMQMTGEELEPLRLDPKLYRNPVCSKIDKIPCAEAECKKCDARHVRAVLDRTIIDVTPYLCPFGQVDVVVPVHIGAATVAAFFGGQASFRLWPEAARKTMIEGAIRDRYLEAAPERPEDAGREVMAASFARLGITGLDPDSLLAEAEEYMRKDRGQTDMEDFLSDLRETAAIIEGLANEKYFADLLSHVSGMVLGEPSQTQASATEQDLWHAVQHALSVVRRSLGFEAAMILTNTVDTPGHFEIVRRLRIQRHKISRLQKRKGPCELDTSRLLLSDHAAVQSYLFQELEEWLLGVRLDPMWGIPVSLDPSVKRLAVLVLFGSEAGTGGLSHPSSRERASLERLSGQLVVATQTRYADIALRERTRQQEMFMEDLRHELKAPIQSIMAQAELLAIQAGQGRFTREQMEQADTAIMAEVAELITRMDTMSLISVLDKVELHRTPMHVSDVVKECVARYQPVATQNSIRLSDRYLGDRAAFSLVNLDAERFTLVVDNLLHNAIKYSYPGTTVRVEVGGTSVAVVLRITNVGARIPKEKYDKIFEKFERLNEQESQFRFRPGTGIGLAIVRKMVLLHGGRVSVESREAEKRLWPPNHTGRTPNQTTFTVELPNYTREEG